MLLLLVVLNVKTRRRVIVLAPSLSSPPNSIYQIRQIEKHFCIPTQQIPYHFFLLQLSIHDQAQYKNNMKQRAHSRLDLTSIERID